MTMLDPFVPACSSDQYSGGGGFLYKKRQGVLAGNFEKRTKILFCGHDLKFFSLKRFQVLHNTNYSPVIFFLLNTLRDRPLFSWKTVYEKFSSANFYFLFMYLCRYFFRTISSWEQFLSDLF